MVVRRQEAEGLRPGRPGRWPQGDWWDHVAYDPEHKLVLVVVPGASVGECAREVVGVVKDRLGNRPQEMFTSGENAAYETAIAETFGEPEPVPTGRRPPGLPRASPRWGSVPGLP
jgi:hypothetical protein